MSEFCEAGAHHEPAPCFQIVISAVAAIVPALAVVATGIGAEQNTTGFQRCPQFIQNPGQLLAGYMEQGCVGKYAIEPIIG